MKFRLRSAHRGLTGCGLRHGPIGRLPCRAVPCRAGPCRAGPGRAGLGDRALRPPVLPMHGRVSGRSATADPRIDRSGRRMFERRPGGAPLPGARATRDRRLDSSPDLPRIPSNSPGIRPESAPNAAPAPLARDARPARTLIGPGRFRRAPRNPRTSIRAANASPSLRRSRAKPAQPSSQRRSGRPRAARRIDARSHRPLPVRHPCAAPPPSISGRRSSA